MIVLGHVIGHVVLKPVRDHMMRHVIGSQGHVVLKRVRDHVIHHVLLSQGHVSFPQGHVWESSLARFGYNLALGSDWVDLGLLHAIPS